MIAPLQFCLITSSIAGKVAISRKEIAKLIGKVFLQRAAVNLLSTVLDTPEYFWSAPDSMQSLYKRVCEYMELDERVEVLNNRFQVAPHEELPRALCLSLQAICLVLFFSNALFLVIGGLL